MTACFADEELPLDADGAEILSETFKILSLKEMKLQAISSAAGGTAGDDAEDEEKMATMAKAVLQAAQKKVVSQVSSIGRRRHSPCSHWASSASESSVKHTRVPTEAQHLALTHRSRRRPSLRTPFLSSSALRACWSKNDLQSSETSWPTFR